MFLELTRSRVENTVYAAAEELSGHNRLLSGQVRLGTTEGFGTFVVAPHLAHFCARHPHITVDLLPVPRFVNLSKREADIEVTIERPQSGNDVVTKLTNYLLKLYAARSYLENHAPIRTVQDLASHPFIGYVDDLVLSEELRYKDNVAPPLHFAPSAAPASSPSTTPRAAARAWRSCPASWPSKATTWCRCWMARSIFNGHSGWRRRQRPAMSPGWRHYGATGARRLTRTGGS